MLFTNKNFIREITIHYFIVRRPDLIGKIPVYVLYGSILFEFLRIAKCSLKFSDFLSNTKQLFLRMMNQGANQVPLLKQIKNSET